MDAIEIDAKSFQAADIPTVNSNILLIQGTKGFLGCGYFDIATADKLGEAVAIVTGVKTYEDMLEAKVVRVSKVAGECGVQEGMSGGEALVLLA